jgi:membrane dipeptidase
MNYSREELEGARALLRKHPLIDGHNDLPWQYRKVRYDLSRIDFSKDTSQSEARLITDIPRLRAGGVGAQFWAVYLPPKPGGPVAVEEMLHQIDFIRRLAGTYPHDLHMAYSPGEIEKAHQAGKVACLIGLEGGYCINNSLATLRMAYELGVRYLTLTHVKTTDWADAAGDQPRHGGLAPFGEEVIREMNRLGMMVDLSHVSDDVMRQAFKISRAPVIFSHSSARTICNHLRNVPDDVLRLVPAKRGIVMVCFLPGYLNNANAAHFNLGTKERTRLAELYPNDPEKEQAEMAKWREGHPAPPATVFDVADHIDYLKKLIGVDHIGIGSDFEGYNGTVACLEDVSKYPVLFAELKRRGYSDEELGKIAGRNLLRVFREVEAAAENR